MEKINEYHKKHLKLFKLLKNPRNYIFHLSHNIYTHTIQFIRCRC
uniref:Uncharacterized protein n=1 Tax=Rhizophora mucronata TaxID=61149 RepID=A0A2P2Q3D0_RHIMU